MEPSGGQLSRPATLDLCFLTFLGPGEFLGLNFTLLSE